MAPQNRTKPPSSSANSVAAVGAASVEPKEAVVGAIPAANGAEPTAVVVAKIKSWNEVTIPKNKEGCIPCEEYVDALELSVRNRLPPALGEVGLKIEGTLEQQNPVKIKGDHRKQLRSFKEHWRWENCVQSLEDHSIYEAPGNGSLGKRQKSTVDGEGPGWY